MKKLLLVVLAWFALAGGAFAAVNINTATKAELESLNGIGPVKAQAIIDYRTKNGPFKSLEDVDKVPGVGAGIMAKIKNEVSLSGTTSVAASAGKSEAKAAKKADAKAAKKDDKPAPAAAAPMPATKDSKAMPAPAAAATKDAGKAVTKDTAAMNKAQDKAMSKTDKAQDKAMSKTDRVVDETKAAPGKKADDKDMKK